MRERKVGDHGFTLHTLVHGRKLCLCRQTSTKLTSARRLASARTHRHPLLPRTRDGRALLWKHQGTDEECGSSLRAAPQALLRWRGDSCSRAPGLLMSVLQLWGEGRWLDTPPTPGDFAVTIDFRPHCSLNTGLGPAVRVGPQPTGQPPPEVSLPTQTGGPRGSLPVGGSRERRW